MKKREAKVILGDLAEYWCKLGDEQQQTVWDTFNKDEKNAVHTLFGMEGLPVAVQKELAAKKISSTCPEVPDSKQAINGSGEGGDALPVPLLAEITPYDLLIAPSVPVHPLMVQVERGYDVMFAYKPKPEPAVAEPEPTPLEIPPELAERINSYTVEEADLQLDINKYWGSLIFMAFVILLCVFVVYRVLCL